MRWNLAGVAAGMAILIVVLGLSGASASGILSALGSVPWPAYAVAALVQGGIVALAAWKWRIVLAETLNGRTVPMGTAVSATATGALFGQVISIQVSVPIVRVWAARRHGIGAGAAAGTSLFEQVLELLTLAVAAAASVVLVATGGRLWIAALVMLGLLAIGTQAIRPVLVGAGWSLARVPLPGALTGVRSSLVAGLDQAAGQRPAVLRQLMAISLVRYGTLVALNVGLVRLILPEVSLVPLVAAFPLILLLSSLPFLPAGLGATELSWVGVLIAQGIDPGAAAEAAIALRVVSLAAFLSIFPVLFLAGRDQGRHSI